jgi:ACS family tartrate transporter-like MFS transporter
VALGFVVLRYLTDRPEEAGWLTPVERDGLAAQLARAEKGRAPRHAGPLLGAVTEPRVWLLILLYFTVAAGSNAMGFYLPKILKDRFAGATEFQIGLLAAVPNVCAIVGMVLNGGHSDRTGERRWHVALPAFLAAAGWAASAGTDSPMLSLVALTLVQVGIMSMLPTFWSLATALLSTGAAAGGIALINSVGNLGGFAGPNLLGQFQAATGNFTGGLLTLALLMALGGALALCVRPAPASEGSKG